MFPRYTRLPGRQAGTALAGSLVALLALVLLGVSHYDWNVSGLLHMDVPFGERHDVPAGLVLYQDAAYDGMLYYQIIRDLPALFTDGQTSLDSPYRFQRILLPLLTYIVTLGQERAYPSALLLLNLAAALGSLAVLLAITKRVNIHAFTIIANPAMLVGILYTLTEPLSIFFMLLFFLLWTRNNQRLTVLSIVMLGLSMLARETTVFLIGLLFLWYLWKRQWVQALLAVVPIFVLIVWQFFLVRQLGEQGFQANSNLVDFPFWGPLSVITRLYEHVTSYLLSGLALTAFVFPLFFHSVRTFIRKKTSFDVWDLMIAGLAFTMITMDHHMWGAITSIGRVVTPVYPVYALYASSRDTVFLRVLSGVLIAVSVIAAIGIASVPHPFIIS
jgi:hypothetical protein